MSLPHRIARALYFACLTGWITSIPAKEAVVAPVADLISAGDVGLASLSPDGKYVVAFGDFGYLFDTSTFTSSLIARTGTARTGFWRYYSPARKVLWATNDIYVVDYGISAMAFSTKTELECNIGESVIGKVEPGNFDSPWVYSMPNKEAGTLAKVNTATCEFQKIRIPVPGNPMNFVFDARGALRALTVRDSAFWNDETKLANWYKPAGDAPWEKLAEFRITDNYWLPIFVPKDEGQLYVMSSIGRDTQAVFSYDTRRRELGEVLAGHPSQDILHADGLDQNAFRSVITQGMKIQVHWFDAAWGGAQKSIDGALPNRLNYLSGDPANKLLVQSFSDTSPAKLYLYDAKARTLQRITFRDDKIDPARMRPMEVVSYASADGLVIPAYLTRPAESAKPRPAVVLIHGGPWLRDHWGWDPEVQILASRGYVVLQPQFRGSSGFGTKFHEAGYRQWGLSMQDDITAGVEYLIRNGIADPKRICIVGASYGGYAALWGLVKTPQLYRCGVSFAGVSDIEFMFNDSSDRNSDKVTRELMRWRVGDSKLSKAQFDSVSPLKHAERINAAVLLMHGEKDERVPVSHSRKMMEALKRAGKPFDWQGFEDAGHSPGSTRNYLLYYEKLLAFLEKHIGTDSTGGSTEIK